MSERATLEEAERAYLVCSCCGALIRNTAEENASHDQKPYPHDVGFGMCLRCGGDPKAKDLRKKMGWAFCMFIDARIPKIAEALNEEHRAKFLAMPYGKKVRVVTWFIENGRMT